MEKVGDVLHPPKNRVCTICSRDVDPVPTFNWFFEYQPIAWETLAQPCRYKRAKSNMLADEKVHV